MNAISFYSFGLTDKYKNKFHGMCMISTWLLRSMMIESRYDKFGAYAYKRAHSFVWANQIALGDLIVSLSHVVCRMCQIDYDSLFFILFIILFHLRFFLYMYEIILFLSVHFFFVCVLFVGIVTSIYTRMHISSARKEEEKKTNYFA